MMIRNGLIPIAYGGVEVHSMPLIDSICFIAIHKPGQEAHPIQVIWHISIIEKKSAENQRRVD